MEYLDNVAMFSEIFFYKLFDLPVLQTISSNFVNGPRHELVNPHSIINAKFLKKWSETHLDFRDQLPIIKAISVMMFTLYFHC